MSATTKTRPMLIPTPQQIIDGVCQISDLFCGGGGSSSGLVQAAAEYGVQYDMTAVNHWDLAVETHTANHPHIRHKCINVERVIPSDLSSTGRLNIMWASPSCGEFSYAKGGTHIDDQNRIAAFSIVTHAGSLQPDIVIVENVVPFRKWGPIEPVPNGRGGFVLNDDGTKKMRPIKSRIGETFRTWFAAMESVGRSYTGHQWILNGADFGAPQSRTRLFCVFTAPGITMQRPMPTHGKPDSLGVAQGTLKPYNGARNIIDFTLPTQSIFDRKKPLSANTMKRIEAGIKKYCSGPVAQAFLVVLRNHMGAQSLDMPIPTITSNSGPTHYLAEPRLTPIVGGNRMNNVPVSINDPMPTVTTATGGGLFLGEPTIEPFVLGQQGGATARSLDSPLPTIATKGAISVTEPYIVEFHSGKDRDNSGRTKSLDDPLPVITTNNRFGVLEPMVVDYAMRDGNGSGKDASPAKPVSEPLPTIITRDRFGVVEPFISDLRHGENSVRNADLDTPLTTIATKNGLGIVEPFFTAHFGEREGQAPRVHGIDDPLWTVTHRGAGDLAVPSVEPFIVPQQGHGVDSIDSPLQTVTTTSRGVRLLEPSITDHGSGRVVEIDGKLYRLDLGFRMLQPQQELGPGQGFSRDYIYAGGKGDATKMIGNAVQVEVAHVLGCAAFEALGYTRLTDAVAA